MDFKIENNLNIWKLEDPSSWYRIDKKIRFFFKKIKYVFQRAKYGWCDRDLWSLDYTLGNYIASSVNELANRTHGYPLGTTPEEWEQILRGIARNFYLGTNEECWSNPYDDLSTHAFFDKELGEEERKAIRDKWIKVEQENARTMEIRRQEGFHDLQKWFTDLWD